jgi:hypothetical protein
MWSCVLPFKVHRREQGIMFDCTRKTFFNIKSAFSRDAELLWEHITECDYKWPLSI